MSKTSTTLLRPHQWSVLSEAHGKALRSYVESAVTFSGLLVIVPITAAALGLEYALMHHTMQVLLDVQGVDQPITLLSLSSLFAIVGLHIIARQLDGTILNRVLSWIGGLAIAVFVTGFGLTVSMTTFEIAASVLLDPDTELDELNALLSGETEPVSETSLGDRLIESFGEVGGTIAVTAASCGLGGIFYISMLVIHHLVTLAFKNIRTFSIARMRYRTSRYFLNRIKAADAALREAVGVLDRLKGTPRTQIVHDITAELSCRSDQALAEARRARRRYDLIRAEDRTDPIGWIGLAVLGFEEEALAINVDEFLRILSEVEESVSEEALKKIAINFAKGISG